MEFQLNNEKNEKLKRERDICFEDIETKLYDIEVHPFLADEFDDSNPFALEILKTGKRLI